MRAWIDELIFHDLPSYAEPSNTAAQMVLLDLAIMQRLRTPPRKKT